MTESKSRKAKVIVLGDGWKNAIQDRMGSEELCEKMRLEHEAAVEQALQAQKAAEESKGQEVEIRGQETICN